MAVLPIVRPEIYIRPFTNVGMDYFGPLEITVGRHTEKRWGVIYTCLSIRAIHLELVNSLTTDSCIRSLMMFSARRGQPQRIYSDNATNFHGANNALVAEMKNIDTSQLINRMQHIQWFFVPPGSPHFGGAWERLIRTVKSNLYAII